MQLHPHFLFNALNAISELIHKEPESADRMLTDLSDLLRMSSKTSKCRWCRCGRSWNFCEKYLEIEQMRFHDRLKVEMRISPDTLDAGVPNMILQPLVENAIKHRHGTTAFFGREYRHSRRPQQRASGDHRPRRRDRHSVR